MTKRKENPETAGRHTLYQESYNEQAYKLCLLGLIDEELARYFGIAVSTLNLWKQAHPIFMESIQGGREEADANVAMSLYKRATGYEIKEQHIIQFEGEVTEIVEIDKHIVADTRAQMFWLKNRKASTWREKQEIEHSGSMVVFDGEQDIKD